MRGMMSVAGKMRGRYGLCYGSWEENQDAVWFYDWKLCGGGS